MEPDTANKAPPLVLVNHFGPVKSPHLLQAAQKKKGFCKQNHEVCYYNGEFARCTILVHNQENVILFQISPPNKPFHISKEDLDQTR
jgi:hypothetical protein